MAGGNVSQPEMELIDQLEGGPMPLSIVRHVFNDDERAKQVLAIYIDRGVIELTRIGTSLPKWEAKQLIRDEEPLLTQDDLCLTLTEAGAKAFEAGCWKNIS